MRLAWFLAVLLSTATAAQELFVRVVDQHCNPLSEIPVIHRPTAAPEGGQSERPLADLWFQVRDIPYDQLDRHPNWGHTDEHGWVHFLDVPRQALLVQAQATSERHAVTEHLDLRRVPLTTQMTLVLDPTIPVVATGRVVDLAGHPLEGAEVSWSPSPGRWFLPSGSWVDRSPRTIRGFPPVRTDAEGRFTLPGDRGVLGSPGPRQHSRQIIAAAEGYLTAYHRAAGDLTNLELTLAPATTIHGLLLLEGRFDLGDPEVTVSVWVRSAELGHRISEGWPRLTRGRYDLRSDGVLGDDGLLLIQAVRWGEMCNRWPSLPQPVWLLLLSNDGRMAAAHFHVGVHPGQVIDLGEPALRRFHTLRGQVVTSQTAPVPGIRVSWAAPSVDETPHDQCVPEDLHNLIHPSHAREQVDPTPRWTASTDAQGRFSLHLIPEGTVDLWVHGQRMQIRGWSGEEMLLPLDD